MKKILLITILITNTINLFSQQNFVELLNEYKAQTVRDVVELNNHYYFISQYWNSTKNQKASLYKVNTMGTVLDTCKIVFPFDTFNVNATRIYKRGNNHLVVYGIYFDDYQPVTHIFINLKVFCNIYDENLNLIYSKIDIVPPVSDINNIYAVREYLDKVYYCFTRFNPNNNSFMSSIVVTDTIGHFLFEKIIINPKYYFDILRHPNEKDLLLFYRLHNIQNGYLHVLDSSNLSIISEIQTVSTYNIQPAQYAIQSFDNSSILLGHIQMSLLQNEKDTFVLYKIDTNGVVLQKTNLEVDSTFSYPVNIALVSSTLNFRDKNNIYFGGNYKLNFSGFPSYFQVANLDSNLNIKWCKSFGGNFSYFINSYYATSDGGCLVLGSKVESATDTVLPIVFKINNQGTITSITNLSNPSQAEVYIYPNPATHTLHFVMQNIAKGALIKIYNMAGTQVKEIYTNETNRCETDISELPTGIYTYRIVNNNREMYSGKWVKE